MGVSTNTENRPVDLVEDKQHDLRDLIYGYYINLNERGYFYADVRDADGNTVYEIRDGASLEEDEASIFEDGYMRHVYDLSGLTEHLRTLGVIPQNAEVLMSSEFEKILEEYEDDEYEDDEYEDDGDELSFG